MRSSSLSLTLPIALCGLLAPREAWSAEASLYIELPRAVYRPYVAVWLEGAADKKLIGNFAVWFDKAKSGNRGAQWLPDLRQWWRKSGGYSAKTMDGISGASRAAGVHTINVASAQVMSSLAPGDYEIVVEAVREHGGYDLLRLPLTWPPSSPKDSMAQGKREVGRVRLSVGP